MTTNPSPGIVERPVEALDHLCASIEAENERGIGVSGTLMSDMREARAALSTYHGDRT